MILSWIVELDPFCFIAARTSLRSPLLWVDSEDEKRWGTTGGARRVGHDGRDVRRENVRGENVRRGVCERGQRVGEASERTRGWDQLFGTTRLETTICVWRAWDSV